MVILCIHSVCAFNNYNDMYTFYVFTDLLVQE